MPSVAGGSGHEGQCNVQVAAGLLLSLPLGQVKSGIQLEAQYLANTGAASSFVNIGKRNPEQRMPACAHLQAACHCLPQAPGGTPRPRRPTEWCTSRCSQHSRLRHLGSC
jgi:hypothetical protein